MAVSLYVLDNSILLHADWNYMPNTEVMSSRLLSFIQLCYVFVPALTALLDLRQF